MLTASLVHAGDSPMTLVSDDEAEPIHSAIVRKELWTQDSVRRLRVEADRRMREGPWSVTFDRPRVPGVDPHEYYSEAPYWWPNPDNPAGPYIRKEGQANPNRFLANRAALNSMCDAVFTLGSAAFFLDDQRYSQRAARVINTWFVNPATRMEPDQDYAQVIPGISIRGSGVIEGRCLIRAVQGMEFLAQTGGWDARDEAAVRKWFSRYLHWLTKDAAGEKRSGNSHAAWWTAQVAAAATFVNNHKAAQAAFNLYRDRVFPRQAPGESLEPDALICRIAQVQGIDLWRTRTRGGATLANTIDSMRPAEIPNDELYVLVFAGIGMSRPEYVALFRRLERPEGAWLNIVDLIAGRWEAASHQTRH
jgi:hypothetical protein